MAAFSCGEKPGGRKVGESTGLLQQPGSMHAVSVTVLESRVEERGSHTLWFSMVEK